jgi:putative chitinase
MVTQAVEGDGVTESELLAILPYAKPRIAAFFSPLCAAMVESEINSKGRQAAFIAQIGHESGQLRYVRELASGEDYEGRKDLGNTEPGDGVRFKGRGLIQITGRVNYLHCSQGLFSDDRLIQFPELLEDPVNACRSAAWWWKAHHLNELADAGNMYQITRVINGGTNGLADRLALYKTAKEVL